MLERHGRQPPTEGRQSSIRPVPTRAIDLTRNAVDVLPEGRLEQQLARGTPLRVKLGIDPTTADIHLGHTVVLEKLREFQLAGHRVVLIIGDFTARVGDPSGRSAQRPVPTAEEIEANATTYQEQAFKILDSEQTEVRRNSERGVHAVCFSEIPSHLGLPSIHSGQWDPFFAACQETRTTINMHIGSSSRMPATSPDAPTGVAATLSFNNAMASMSDWLFSGKLVQFPELVLAYSEGQIGWIPYILERADTVWEEHRAWAHTQDLVPEPPSTYYYRQIYGCFFRDRHGIESIDIVGPDNVTFETDYPHTDSTWPHTRKVAEELMSGVPQDVVDKVMRTNAARMLHLDL